MRFPIGFILALSILCSCHKAEVQIDTLAAGTRVLPSSFATISPNGRIRITFSETMSPATLQLAGDLASQSDGGTWSSAALPSDTLILAPKSTWRVAADQTLTVNASDASEIAIPTLSLTYTISDTTVFVRTTGSDSADGSSESPQKTIQHAIDYASSHYGAGSQVFVGEGTYSVSSTLNLVAAISVYGSFDEEDWGQRSVTATPSIISDTRTVGGVNLAPISPLSLSGNYNYLTFDRFVVNAGSGTHSAAMATSNAYHFTFSNCIFNGGSGATRSSGVFRYNDATDTGLVTTSQINGGSGGTSHGVYATGTSAQFTSNTISGGSASTNYGVYLNQATTFTLSSNTISGGSGTTSYGVYGQTTNAVITGNTISGGTGSTEAYGVYTSSAVAPYPTITGNTILGGTSASTYGVYTISAAPTISRNRVFGGTSSLFSSGIYQNSSSATVSNNVVYGGVSNDATYGIYLFNPGSHKVFNNTVNGGSGGTGGGATNRSAAVYLFGPTSPQVSNNILTTQRGTNRYGVYMGGLSGVGPTLNLKNNAFFNCPTTSYYNPYAECVGNNDADASNVTCNTTDINGLAGTTIGSGNVTLTASFVSASGNDGDITTIADNDWSLASDTPSGISTGGLDGTTPAWGFTVDFSSVTRTGDGATGWSMGAFELD